ncbi:B12-binding domain-containing radical SAM protein [Magnetococcus sp. PR-3]|uniref:B12-binding domain-containing radical SAM protein n=1 Tax=Magnetococcus sp. PR-3 TaxID=3120355 RepID=UPI002FCE113A
MIQSVLVNPPMTAAENYGDLADMSPEFPLLGLAFMTTYAKQAGHHVALLDLANATIDQAVAQLAKYDLVGMSAYITNVRSLSILVQRLKQAYPHQTLVIGGPHATLFPHDFEEWPVDYVVSGEGEQIWVSLLEALNQGIPPKPMPGLGMRQAMGKLVIAGKADVVNNLDEIGPPDISQYDMARYYSPMHIRGKKVIHTLTTRGCPFKCTFCAATEVMGRTMRFRSVPDVIEELKRYRDQGYDSLMFYDDIFTIRKRHVFELCEAMAQNHLKFKWTCFTRTNAVNDRDMLAAMRQTGCYLITFGCETAHDKTLALMKKGLTQEDNVRGIENVHQAGIKSLSSFMIGLPNETAEDIQRTIDFATRSKLTFAVFPIFEPFKGTAIYETCKETGRWVNIKGEKNSLLVDDETIWVPNTISRAEIQRLAASAFKQFYFKPDRLMKVAHHALWTLPPARAWKFMHGGLSYFLRKSKDVSAGLLQGSRY